MMQKQETIEGFTVPMALFDALPVLFFIGSTACVSVRFHSVLFQFGAVLMACGGLCKVMWKLLLGLQRGDCRPLTRAFVPLMAGGCVLIAASVFCNLGRIHFAAVWQALLSFPSVLFFALGLMLMLLMAVLAGRFERRNAKANWNAQLVNAFAQGAIFLGMLLL